MPVAITRRFAAPRRRVFETLTSAAHLERWLSTEGFAVPLCHAEPRPGGAFQLKMRSSEGRPYAVSGTYREVAAPARLVIDCTAADERRSVEATVEVVLDRDGAGTRLTLAISAAPSSACARRAGASP